MPVEYKMGTRHGNTADIQLCAQALCLEEMFAVTISTGALWFGAHRRRVTIQLDTALRQQTIQIIDAVHAMRYATTLPGAPNDNRCTQCQLFTECLPDIVADPETITRYMQEEVWG